MLLCGAFSGRWWHVSVDYSKDNDNEDSEDDEDEDVRPPIRRKRLRRESDATETATRKKVHTRSCTTPGSTVSRGSTDDAESIPSTRFLKSNRQEAYGYDAATQFAFLVPASMPNALLNASQPATHTVFDIICAPTASIKRWKI
jgi:hypothetical protein